MWLDVARSCPGMVGQEGGQIAQSPQEVRRAGAWGSTGSVGLEEHSLFPTCSRTWKMQVYELGFEKREVGDPCAVAPVFSG